AAGAGVPASPRRAGGRPVPHRLGGRAAQGEHVRMGALPGGVTRVRGVDRPGDETAGGSGGGGQPGRGFGEAGEGYLRLALVENEQRLRQAGRQMGPPLPPAPPPPYVDPPPPPRAPP